MNLTEEELVFGAQCWFRSVGENWPDYSPVIAIRAMESFRPRVRDAVYYGTQAVLLMLVTANGDMWPPMAPDSFVKDLPRVRSTITKYAGCVEAVEEERA